MKCRLCGKRLPLGTAECDNCGAKVEWKKYIWLTALVTALTVALVAGLVCGIVLRIQEKPVENTEPHVTEDPTEATPEPTQTEPTDGTETPIVLATDPTNETELLLDWMVYDSLPDGLSAWIHSSDNQWYYDKYNIDSSSCVEGWLYIFSENTGELTLICDEDTGLFCSNSEYIFYTTKENPKTVIRSTLDGDNKVILHTGCNVTYLDWCGGVNGVLCMVADRTDIIAYDVVTGIKTKIFSYHDIWKADLSYWVSGNWIAFDAEDGYWYYNTATGEMWKDNF